METSDDTQEAAPPRVPPGTALWLLISLAGVSAVLTMLYLGMRSVMAIGGSCAEGGPYVIGQRCPKGTALIMVGGIWAGLIFAGIYIWQSSKAKIASLAVFLWPALFLSLGWNFLDFAIRASREGHGLPWGWVICAVMFAFLGGVPLVIALSAIFGGKSRPPSTMGHLGGALKIAASGLSSYRELRRAMPEIVRAMGDAAATWPQASTAGVSTAGGPGTASSGVPGPAGLVSVLAKLDDLHRSGALSDDEYQAAKRQVLGPPS